MSTPSAGLPPDFETRMPDDLPVRVCYRHPERETGVSCSSCGRPICHECMIPAPVGFRCPACVKQQRSRSDRTRVVTRGEMRSRWSGGVSLSSGRNMVTKALIAVNVVMFLLEMLSGASTVVGEGSAVDLFRLGALVPRWVAEDGEYWRLFTAMFLHAGIFHILFNMYALYLGGTFLEMLAGRAKYLAVYFTAGFAGNVVVYLLSPPDVPTIGASTAIFGVFGALFMYSVHFRDTMAGQALRSMGLVILINLLITFAVPGISWQGHIGGLVGGVVAVEALTLFGRRDLRAPLGRNDVVLLALVLAVLVGLVMFRTATFPA